MEFAVGISNQTRKMQSGALLANAMDIHSDFAGAASSTLYIDVSLCKTEDSGYQTSFTPGSIEHSAICRDYLDQSVITSKACITGQIHYVTPEVNTNFCRQSKIHNEKTDTPLVKRGLKRSYQDAEISDFPYSPIPTPTSLIAGKIQSLDFNENKENTCNSRSIGSPDRSNSHTRLYREHESYPLTPIKKNCKLNPCRKSAKKLDFIIHSLSCESRELQTASRQKRNVESVKTVLFRPDKKIDIMQLLYQIENAIPPITKVLSYLSNEDIYNFNLVSKTWAEIWSTVSEKKQKQKYEKYLWNAKENRENRDSKVRVIERKMNIAVRPGCLKELHYEQIISTSHNIPISPPGTPRTNRFKKFTKSASLDTRAQLSCVRCSQPAKVTEETSGEEWAECTNKACSYQFCRYCHSDRHPGTKCFQYDLDGPSPSKRKKTQCAVGTKKSKKNLRRLL